MNCCYKVASHTYATIYSLIGLTSTTPLQDDMIVDIFRMVDKNSDSAIDLEELKEAVRSAILPVSYFSDFDTQIVCIVDESDGQDI